MLGSEFKALRLRAKLTQLQASIAIGVTPITVSRWERLETVPRLAELALRWITQDVASHESAEDKATREQEQRRHAEAAWAAMPPWDDNERSRRRRLGLPMHDVNPADIEREKRLAELEAKNPGIFGNEIIRD